MQISANNLLIAAQQARTPSPAKPAAERPTEPEKSAAPPADGSAQRPGSRLDIRV